MAESKAYSGGCHCGAVKYRVTTALDGAITCNCSICTKVGSVLTFVPASAFELLSGGDALTDYQFGRKNIHHLFCSRCGVKSFGRGRLPDGSDMVAINVRCLDGIDVDAVPTTRFDGRSLPMD